MVVALGIRKSATDKTSTLSHKNCCVQVFWALHNIPVSVHQTPETTCVFSQPLPT